MTKRMTKDDDASELVKKSKIDVMSTTDITGVNEDCLCEIFRWLEFKDLLVLAETNKLFVAPVKRILSKINKQKTFTSLSVFPYRYMTDFIMVPLHSLQYVGQSILKLFIDFAYVAEPYLLENHIMEHCNGLKELKLLNLRDGAFETIKKPFAQLEILTISNGILGKRLSLFQKWFPQLRSLTVTCNVHGKNYILNNMAKTIPSLEFISLTLSEVIPENCSRPTKSLDDVIRSNRQLKGIRLDLGCANRDLRVVKKELKQLEMLELQMLIEDFSLNNKRPIKLGSVKKLILDIKNQDRRYTTGVKCAMTFDNLEELEISSTIVFEEWIFISNSINLKKFKLNLEYNGLSLYNGLSFEQLLQISSTWPNLTDVTMPFINFTVFEMFSFLRSLHNLKRFNILKYSFFTSRLGEIEEMKASVANEYKVLPGNAEYECVIIPQT